MIHPTAIISNKAKIGNNVSIGAFSIIEDDVEIGENTEIRSNVILANGARIGKDCRIFSGSVIASEPQDLKFKGESSLAIIGDRTTVREFVTVNRGTEATGKSVVGDNCLLMAYTHVAHDCYLGNNVIMSNVAQIAGHVHIDDWVIFGAYAKVHQFCNVGAHVMLAADVKILKDVPPYVLIGRELPKIEGINKIGLRRRGFSNEIINQIDDFYNLILKSGYNITDGISKYKESNILIPEIEACINFIEKSERGIYR